MEKTREKGITFSDKTREQLKKQQTLGKNGGVISKATAKRINQSSLSRNSSLSSSHSKSEVSLVRFTRISSKNNVKNNNNTAPTVKSVDKDFEIEAIPPPYIDSNFTSTPKSVQRFKQLLTREKPADTSSSRLRSKLFNTPKNASATTFKKNDSSARIAADRTITKTSRNISKVRSLKKPKSFPDLSERTVKTISKKSSSTNLSSNNNNNNNIKTINRNLSKSKGSLQASSDGNRKLINRRSLDLIHHSRGQGPSGSKNSAASNHQITASGHHQQNQHQHQPLKTSSSVSSLDGIVTGTGNVLKTSSKSSSKNHGSKDKLDQNNYRNSKDKLIDRGHSKERIIDNISTSTTPTTVTPIQTATVNNTTIISEPVILPKTKKKNSPMPIIQQQHTTNNPVHANNNLIDQRDAVNDYNHHHHHNNHSTIVNVGNDKNSTRDLNDINFDGTREANRQQQSMMQELQSHLERLTREKMALEAKIVELSSYQAEVVQLRNEITRLQNIQEKSNNEIQKLTDENETLRNRLRDVVNSPLSDAEKHQIIQDSQRLHSSAPASIALPNNHETDGTPCVTPDWDKHSSSSEISVACLQDKIIQMEETHYSTNEELQATLQELADLQAQLSELQSDNERLAEEKDVLFQSLCRQTEKLEDSRTQIGTLQELLLRESNNQESGTTEREQKLLDLLKSAQEERESLLIKQEELNSELNELRQALEISTNENSRLRERISLLDSTVDAANAERKQIESQLNQAKEESSEKQIEISRLTTLLENARAKIDELEQDRAMGDKTDLGELLDVARKEKDILESQVASLQEQLSKSQCEIQKLKDQLAGITEECKVARNNAKCALSDLEYKYETLKEEKLKLSIEYQQLQDSTNELQVQCKCHLEDKTQLESLLSETQRHLGEAERLLAEKEERLQEEIKQRKQDAEEWEQFQSDLLMTVRVANDFKTEAQSAREQLVMDNKAQREKIRALEQQIEKLNKQVSSDAQQSLLTTVQQEMAARRQKVGGNISRQDSRLSVKSLIESIENVNKQTKSAGPGSRCSSSSSLNSLTSDAMNGGGGGQNGISRNTTGEWVENGGAQQHQLHTPVVTGLQAKSPLREQQQTAGTNINLNGSQKNLISDFGKKTSTLYLNNNNNVTITTTMSSSPAITTSTTSASTIVTTINHNNNNSNSNSTNNNNNTNNSNHNNNNSNCNNNNNSNINSTNNHHYLHGRVCSKQTSDDPYVASILSQKTMDFVRRNSYGDLSERKDPLNALVKNGGSKRNALLKWCQNKTVGYRNIDITNFSSSWNDGLAFCAILHSYLPDRVPYDTLGPNNKRRNFSIAFSAAESVGIPTTLNINDMCQQERPDWTQVMAYVTAIYKHFET